MKPLVLHVAPFANPSGGSFVDALLSLARRDEFRTGFLCPSSSLQFAWASRLRDAGVELFAARTPFDVTAAAARISPEIVHAHFAGWMLPATLGGAAARARIAWHLHSGVAGEAPNRELGRRVKYASAKRLVERFFCVSPDLVAYLERYGVPSARIAELPNGVDLERFRPPDARERATARARFGLASTDRVLAFFGRDAFVKGADLLAAALAETARPPVVLAVAASSETRAALRRYPFVDAGHLVDAREALWAADAIVLPSRSEGVPYALLEARACGLPAVASPLDGVVRVLANDDGTQIVRPDDPPALAAAVARALTRGPVRPDERVRRTISLDAWADALAAWYVAEAAA